MGQMPQPLLAAGVLTGWGPHVAALPEQAPVHTALVPLPAPEVASERLRRATRECLLGVAVVEQVLRDQELSAAMLGGPHTGLVYASASSYVAANWTFLTGSNEQALHFPYTAPSAVPGEVSIQYGLTGPYLTLLSGANAGVEALWQAASLLTSGQCKRALVLGVETFAECMELFTAGRWLLGLPLVEIAACLLFACHPCLATVRYRAGNEAMLLALLEEVLQGTTVGQVYVCTSTRQKSLATQQRLQKRWPHLPLFFVRERLGTCLASAPLLALMLAAASAITEDIVIVSHWWDAWAVLRWPAQALRSPVGNKLL